MFNWLVFVIRAGMYRPKANGTVGTKRFIVYV